MKEINMNYFTETNSAPQLATLPFRDAFGDIFNDLFGSIFNDPLTAVVKVTETDDLGGAK